MSQYVFTFLGEFGYELLNWQGVVRKFRTQAPPGTRIVACSRAGMDRFYESADEFVDISAVEEYQQSVAAGYTVLGEQAPVVARAILEERFRERFCEAKQSEYVWSFEDRTIEGLRFGGGGIYANLDLKNNQFCKIEPDLDWQTELEKQLGFGLDEPYILCQAARREIITRDPGRVPMDRIIAALAKRTRIVLLNFDTGRALDSYSQFGDIPNTYRMQASTLGRQGCLIQFARKCVFMTEGDFRSHMYVPPFLGKDVHAVAPAGVYDVVGYGGVNTAPIEFWNETVFRFGGRIQPWTVERICRNDQSLNEFADQICA